MKTTALTIGGSDSSGGAGIQADLKTFTVLRVWGLTAITAITAQNTTGVASIQALRPEIVAQQIDAVATDFPIHACKTGMLANAAIIEAVAESLRKNSLAPYVCDPVVYAKSGAELLDPNAIHALRQELLPLAEVVTPNRVEAAMLANIEPDELTNVATARKCAEKILKSGVRSVVIKGLHTGTTVTDLFYDGDHFLEFPAKRINTRNTHGSGCMYAAILTALLAQGVELPTAVDNARSFISNAIEHHVRFGAGTRPVNPLALTPE